MNNRPRINKLSSKPEKIEVSNNLSGLARSHCMIRVEKNKEIQFLKLCAQIRLDDFKKVRADRQRNERRDKRFNHLTIELSQ